MRALEVCKSNRPSSRVDKNRAKAGRPQSLERYEVKKESSFSGVVASSGLCRGRLLLLASCAAVVVVRFVAQDDDGMVELESHSLQ